MGTKDESLVDYSNLVKFFNKRADQLMNDPEELKKATSGTFGNPVSLGPRVVSPEKWADDQVASAVAKSAKWLERVKAPRKNPIESAIAADKKRVDKLNEANRLGKWPAAMRGVNVDLMYETIDKRGESAFRSGLEDRKAKIVARVKELQPLVVAVAETIDKMPDATDADREKRLLAARKLMIELGKKRRGLKAE